MRICDLGVIGYHEALEFQKDVLAKRISGALPDTLIILEHKPVLTLGRLTENADFIDREYFANHGIPVIASTRGGRATYHAPGQIVLYPVVDLGGKKKDVAWYMNLLEETVAGAVTRLGLPAERISGKRGVWVGGQKIAFFGVAFKKWVTYHGASVNINNDLEAFSRIAPCGESSIRVTSAKKWSRKGFDMSAAKRIFAEEFERRGF